MPGQRYADAMTLQQARDIVANLQSAPGTGTGIREEKSPVRGTPSASSSVSPVNGSAASPVANRLGDSIAGMVAAEVEREMRKKDETIAFLTDKLAEANKEAGALKRENQHLASQVGEYRRAMTMLKDKVSTSVEDAVKRIESPNDAYFKELEMKVETLEKQLSEHKQSSPQPSLPPSEAFTPAPVPGPSPHMTPEFASPDFSPNTLNEVSLKSEVVQNIFNTALFSMTKGDLNPVECTKDVITDPLLLLKSGVSSPRAAKHVSWFKPVLRFMAAARERRTIQPLIKRGVKTYIPVALSNVPQGGSSIEGARCMLSIPLGLPSPSTAGSWEPMLSEGKLFKLLQHHSKGKTLLLYNGTREMLFTLEYYFEPSQSQLQPGPTVTVNGPRYTVSIPAGETINLVSGIFGKYEMTINYGPPNKDYLSKFVQKYDKQVTEQLCKLREAALLNKVDLSKDRDVVQMCLKEGLQYIDWRFPPRQTGLARPWEVRGGKPAVDEYPWMRPKDYMTPEVARSVSLFASTCSDGDDDEPIQPNDIDQGKLGDCWLLCAISAMAEQPELIRKIFYVPEVDGREQECGAYCLRVCKHGWWQTVTVDNYLPSHTRGPVFASNIQEPSELWVAILEKVVAKVHGSYSAIISGDSIEALQDLTGYPAERFRWDDPGLFSRLLMFDDASHGNGEYLMTIETPGVDKSVRVGGTGEEDTRYESMGLVSGHAYALLTVLHVRPSNGPRDGFKLCRIRNPWGDAKEWKGKWGDDDGAWTEYPDMPEMCGLEKGSDGTFWMEWHDVQKWFCGGGVCFVSPSWHDIRIATAVYQGRAIHMLEINPDETASCFIGLHQRDRRGLKDTDTDQSYSAFLISVLEPSEKGGWAMPAGGHSHGGSFWRGRDTHLHYTFKKERHGGRPYYVVWQSYSKDQKNIVVSIQASSRFGTINIKRPDKAVLNSIKYSPPVDFNPVNCQLAEANVQLNQTSHSLSSIDMTTMHDIIRPPKNLSGAKS